MQQYFHEYQTACGNLQNRVDLCALRQQSVKTEKKRRTINGLCRFGDCVRRSSTFDGWSLAAEDGGTQAASCDALQNRC